jgi:hypothetical protein
MAGAPFLRLRGDRLQERGIKLAVNPNRPDKAGAEAPDSLEDQEILITVRGPPGVGPVSAPLVAGAENVIGQINWPPSELGRFGILDHSI